MMRIKLRLLTALMACAVLLPCVPLPAGAAGDNEVLFSLDYTRDAFYLKDTGEFTSSFEYPTLGMNIAFCEDDAKGKYGVRNLADYDAATNTLAFDGTTYQFGPLGSVEQSSDEPNAVAAVDGNPIVIDVPNAMYKTIRFLATTLAVGNDPMSAQVSMCYQGETTPEISPITQIGSYRVYPDASTQYAPYEKLAAQVGAERPANPGEANRGYYPGNLYQYELTPAMGKQLDRIEINCQRALVFAATGRLYAEGEIADIIGERIAALPDEATAADIPAIQAIRQMMADCTAAGAFEESELDPMLLDKLETAERQVLRKGVLTTMTQMNYTKDVFANKEEDYVGKDLLIMGEGGMKVTALDEAKLHTLAGYDAATSRYTFDGVTYQLGPVGDLGAPSSAPNAIRGADGNPIVIPMEKQFLSEIRILAHGVDIGNVDAQASVSIYYIDEAAPQVVPDISRFKAFRDDAKPPVLQDNEKLALEVGGIRPDGGAYSGRIYQYTIKPEQGRIVDRISINAPKGIVYAVTGVGYAADETYDMLAPLVAALPAVDSATQADRDVVEAIGNMVSGLKQNGYNDADLDELDGMDRFRALQQRFLRLLAQSSTTTPEQITASFTFSGDVAPASVTNAVSVTLDGTPVAAEQYSAEAQGDTVVVTIQNTLDYGKTYTVTLDDTIASAVDGRFTLPEPVSYSFNAVAPLELGDIDVRDANGAALSSLADCTEGATASVVVHNNTAEALDCVVTLALYTADGAMWPQSAQTMTVPAGRDGQPVTLALPASPDGCTLEAYLWDSLDNEQGMNSLYRAKTFK